MNWNSYQAPVLLVSMLVCICIATLIAVSPPEVAVQPVVMNLLGLLLGVGVACFGLLALATPKGDPSRWLNAGRSTAVVMAIVTVGATVRAGLDIREAEQLSDDILIDRPDMGPGAAVLRPNLRGATVVAPDRPHNPQDLSSGDRLDRVQRKRVFKVDTNSAGFRGPEYSSQSQRLRVVAVGDSFTFGWGVSYDDAWPAQLQRLTGIETINAGVPAANLSVLTRLVEHHSKTWNADVILLTEWPRLLDTNPIGDFVQRVQRARLAATPAKLGVLLPPVSTFDPLKSDIGPTTVADLEKALGDIPLLDLNVAIEAAGGSGVVLERAGRQQALLRVPSGDIIVQAEGPRDRIADPILDTLDDNPSLKEPLFFDGGHTSAKGNAVAAQAVMDWLVLLGWIQVEP